jgi:hypothetical protein
MTGGNDMGARVLTKSAAASAAGTNSSGLPPEKSTGAGVGMSVPTPSTHCPRQLNAKQFAITGLVQVYANGNSPPGEHGTHSQSISNPSSLVGPITVESHWQSPCCEAVMKSDSATASRGQMISASKVHASPA